MSGPGTGPGSGTRSQDQSEIFRGTADGETRLKNARSVRGTPAASMPAFVLGEELAEMAEGDPRIVVATADLASANRTSDFRDAPSRSASSTSASPRRT